MLAHRLQRWSIIEPTLGECILFARMCLPYIEPGSIFFSVATYFQKLKHKPLLLC